MSDVDGSAGADDGLPVSDDADCSAGTLGTGVASATADGATDGSPDSEALAVVQAVASSATARAPPATAAPRAMAPQAGAVAPQESRRRTGLLEAREFDR